MPAHHGRSDGAPVDADRVPHSVSTRRPKTDLPYLILVSTINIISLLDCAFFFYQNYPCRLTHSEMECELPCEESLFQSGHPFAEPGFRFTRNLTLYETFQNLFEPTSNDSPQRTPGSGQMDLTVLDMFILIHGKQCGCPALPCTS